MRAVVQRRYGGASDVLEMATVVRPDPTGTDVLVRVRAAGVDRGTWHLMTGKPYLLRLVFGIRRPRNPVPGGDLAGTVVAVGPDVTRFSVGDEVYGFGRGTFAEYALAAEDKLAAKPASLSFEQAAVVPVSGATAQQALDLGGAQAGQHVLVVGASGGVGSYAVQLAKALGAEVTGVASAPKLDLVRALGADHVVDHTREDFAAAAGSYDLVLDIGGNAPIRQLRRAATRTGTVVIVGGEDGGSLTGGMRRTVGALALSRFVRQRLTNFVARQRASDLERLTVLVESGDVVPALDTTYPLGRAAEAIELLERGQARGKYALRV